MEACKTETHCVGIYDQCGNGDIFGTCTASSETSSCGSIFLKRPGNMTRPFIKTKNIIFWNIVLFFIIFVHILNLGIYFKSGIGENCPDDQIIDTQNSCKDAAADLGLSYGFSLYSKSIPAGCYWQSKESVNFNPLIVSSETIPSQFGPRGGLCMRSRKRINHRYIRSSINIEGV